MALLERALAAATLLLLGVWLVWGPLGMGRPADAIVDKDDYGDVQEPPAAPSGLPRVPSLFRHKYPRDAVVAQARSMKTDGPTSSCLGSAATPRSTTTYAEPEPLRRAAPKLRPWPHCRPRRAWGAGRGAGQRRRRVRLCGRVAGVDCQG